MSPERVETTIDGQTLSLSNLDKVLYPKTGFTKGEVLNYYARVAEAMLPHLRERPATLKRFPNGVEEKYFFAKHAPVHAPAWIETVNVPHGTSARAREKNEEDINYVIVQDRPTLLWAANLAALEIHVPMWRVGDKTNLPKDPDLMVFDLDPGEGTTIVECCRVARLVTGFIDEQIVLPKTSGVKGLQLYMPLRGVDSQQANEQAHEFARTLERDDPDAVVSNMKKELRKNKVLIDWSQNHPVKTTVAVYSLRAESQPFVSTPITWDEVDACAKSGDPNDLRFEPDDVLGRIEKMGDLFAPLHTTD